MLHERGVLWISDEVQTGWGRTGEHFWGWQAHARSGPPDMLTFAKGIGNGMSIGGVVARAEIMNCLDANSISTFGGTQITMAAGLANLNYLLEHDLQGNARRVGGLLIERLRAAAAHVPAVREVRGRGLMIGIELTKPGTDEADPAAASAVLEAARAAWVCSSARAAATTPAPCASRRRSPSTSRRPRRAPRSSRTP